MDTSFQTSPLLGHDDSFETQQFCNAGLEECSESSSGYDSSDFSDGEYDVIPQPRAVHVSRASMKACMTFRSTETLCEDLMLVMDMPEMCDVTFLVGHNGTPIHGVRAILATRSKVFFQLILKHIQIREMLLQKAIKHGGKAAPSNARTNKLTIPVTKYDTDVFRMLIQFVHSGIVTIDDTNVCGLLCGAVQFQLTDLSHACWSYMSNRLSSASCGISLLDTARMYSRHHRAARDIVQKVHTTLEERPARKYRIESAV